MDPNAEMKRLLSATKVKMEPSCDWYQVAPYALLAVSPMKHGISGKELKNIYHKVVNQERLTYFEFAVVNNAIEDSTVSSLLGMDVDMYFRVLEEATDLAVEWSKFSKTVQDKVTAELISKAQREGGKNGNVISMGEA